MLADWYRHSPDDPLRILALGAHADDIEIGCAGTLLRFIEEGIAFDLRWVVLSAPGARRAEAEESAAALVGGNGRLSTTIGDIRDGFFPYEGARVKEFVESLKSDPPPDLVFTHRREDLHQDHRLLSETTWQTFRGQRILEYEIPKYEGDLGSPNLLVRLSEEVCRRKVDHLIKAFPSQAGRRWYSPDTFWSLLRLRGIEAGDGTGLAEGFVCRKLTI